MPPRRALPPLLLLLLALRAVPAPASEAVESKTPDFGVVNATFAPAADGGATLALTFGADVLGTLPLGVGRTALTLLADAVELPQARFPSPSRIAAASPRPLRVSPPRACSPCYTMRV